MASFPLRRVVSSELPQIWGKLEKHGFQTASDLYVKSELELVHSVELLPWEIERLYSLVGAKVCAPPQTALELWHDARSCPPPLNIFGAAHPLFAFPSRAIIELVGPAGAGKTQCMLALALTAAIPTEHGGLGGRVLYIDTEKAFSPSRMVEMATHRYGEAGRLPASLNLKSIMARVLVHQVSSTEEIAQLLDGAEERMIEDGVVLIIIDSIAAPARKDFDHREKSAMQQRQLLLARIASKLKYLAQHLKICCVVVNQVAASSGRQSADGDQGANAQITSTTDAGDDGNRVHATLGVTWSHAINIRFIIDSFGAVKRVRIGKSPSSANASLLCEITASGLSALSAADAERLGIAGHAAAMPVAGD